MKNLLKNKDLLFLIPTLIWIFAVMIAVAFFSSNNIDSDMSAEMILAKELSAENKLISTNWFYSTELRILNTQLIAVPLFKIFSSFSIVRTIQCLILHILLFFSYSFFMKKFEFPKKYIYLTSMFLYIPFSMIYMSIVQLGNFYIVHYIMSFIMFGILIDLHKNFSKKNVIIFLILSLICGLSGIRYILNITLPAFFCVLVLIFQNSLKNQTPLFSKNTLKSPMLIGAFSGLTASGIGYLINETLLQQIFSFRSYADVSFADFIEINLFYRISNKITAVFKLFGYQDGAGVISVAGICCICAIIAIFIIFMIFRALLKNWKSLSLKENFIINLAALSFLINTFVYIITDSAYNPRYYIVSLVLVIPVLAVFLNNKIFKRKDITTFSAILLSLVLSLNGAVTIYRSIKFDINKDLKGVCQYLQNNNCSFGYASFWNADVLTELSNGNITVVNVTHFSTMQPNKWLFPKRYLDKSILKETPGDKLFILLTKEEFEKNKYLDIIKKGNNVYNNDKYIVLIYDKEAYWKMVNKS